MIDTQAPSKEKAINVQELREAHHFANDPPYLLQIAGMAADEIERLQQLAATTFVAAGKHAERVVELEAEVSTLREHLAEVNRLMSLNVAEIERLRSTLEPYELPRILRDILADLDHNASRIDEPVAKQIKARIATYSAQPPQALPAAWRRWLSSGRWFYLDGPETPTGDDWQPLYFTSTKGESHEG